jgi:hypothetical protein
MRCKICRKQPHEISEYVDAAEVEGVTPEEYVRSEEGTYNRATGLFYCTNCYIAIGMPLGTA